MAPRVGFEPTTFALTERRTTAVLPGNVEIITQFVKIHQALWTERN